MIDSTSRTAWRNAWVILPVALVQGTVYLLLNHHPLRPSRDLPLTIIDEAIPFWPWTVWPYLAMVALEPALPLFIKQPAVFRHLLLAYALALTVAFSFFVFWPTHIVRPAAPADDSLHAMAYNWLTRVDTPECCFPSGHILVPALLCWAVWRDGHSWRWWCLGLFAMASFSVLSTKQHYFWDLAGSLALAGLSIFVAGRLIWKGT